MSNERQTEIFKKITKKEKKMIERKILERKRRNAKSKIFEK